MMSLEDQAAILLEAAEQGLLRNEDIIRWCDQVMVETNQPPAWLVDLVMMGPSHLRDYMRLLREHACLPLALRIRIQVVVLAYRAGFLSLTDCLSKLFQLILYKRPGMPHDLWNDPLGEVLVEWDCLDDLEVIPPALRMKVEAVLRDYQVDAGDVARVLMWP